MSTRPPLPGDGNRVENYTNAFLVSFGGILFMIFIAIWALWGFLAALVLAYGTDKTISRIGTRRSS